MLETYDKKRKFNQTPEPGPKLKSGQGPLRFVVQKHQASHLHYDFRLECGGVLLSWAVPKGPSLNPADKRLAMMVEDHPFDYRDFEGIIPEGNYGAGTVMVWDEGVYSALNAKSRTESEKEIKAGLRKGHITFVLSGQKLKGEFALVKIKGGKTGKGNSWLLLKAEDEYAKKTDITKEDRSVKTGRSMDEIASATIMPKPSSKELKNNKGKKAKIPKEVSPMLATLVTEPFDSKDYVFEIKFDGYRALAEISKKKVRLYSRNNQNFDRLFPQIYDALSKYRRDVLLDGEIVVLDQNGASQFNLIQKYQQEKVGQLAYYVFDILYLDGRDLRDLALIERKEILQKVVEEINSLNIVYSDHIDEKGLSFFQLAQKQSLEGIIAKKKDSSYATGKRSQSWLKIKTHMRQEAVIGGFTAPRGSRKKIGALILGVYDGDELKYIGHTGGGFNDQIIDDLYNKLSKITVNKPPFNSKLKTNTAPTWVKPKYVCEVSFQEWTASGSMRQPIFEGLRLDKKPQEVVREQPKAEEVEDNIKVRKQKARNSKNYEVKVDGHNLELTHLDKVFWPKEKYTKGDVVQYYSSIAELILPYLKDRPESLNRHPNGIKGKNFFQKDIDHQGPEWLKRAVIFSESNAKDINYLVCSDKATLLYMANLGCIEINPWSSRVSALDRPDFMVIDLDPEQIGFDYVVEAALVVKKTLEKLGVKSYCKTSGATGLHIFAPTGGKYDYEQVKEFARLVAILVNRQLPEITSIERMPKKRQGKIYLDFLQNRKGQTLAAPYSLRPKEGATVSTPLKWTEVKKGLDPRRFNIETIFSRIKKHGDLWKPVLGKGFDMSEALRKFQKLEL